MNGQPALLDREEYVEQAYFFTVLAERLRGGLAAQDVLAGLREEVLASTRLPLAVDFLANELKLKGVFGTAMARLPHYFTAFQTYVVAEGEREGGRFDLLLGLEILRREAAYRAEGATPQGIFLYQFEALCRSRLGYDRGLEAVAADPIFDQRWREWILTVRRQIGLVDMADLIYVRSQHYAAQQAQSGGQSEPPRAVLFGEKEGRIALANRHKDPLLLLAALHRQLGYPEVPRWTPVDESPHLVASLARRVERIEARLKLIEEEQRGGIHLARFYGPQGRPAALDDDA